MARIFVIRTNLLGLSARGGQAGLLPIGASTASSRTFIVFGNILIAPLASAPLAGSNEISPP